LPDFSFNFLVVFFGYPRVTERSLLARLFTFRMSKHAEEFINWLQDRHQVDSSQARNIAQLLQDDTNTIPFICRYRAAVHGGLSGEQLREAKKEQKRLETLQDKKEAIWNRIQTERKDLATSVRIGFQTQLITVALF
jgi:transcriptional accessory protein Tex/SPT6